jgi:hypothetical protein
MVVVFVQELPFAAMALLLLYIQTPPCPIATVACYLIRSHGRAHFLHSLELHPMPRPNEIAVSVEPRSLTVLELHQAG